MAKKFGNIAREDLAGRKNLTEEWMEIYGEFYPDARRRRLQLEQALVTEMARLLQRDN